MSMLCDLPLGNKTLLVIWGEILINVYICYVLKFSFQADTVALQIKLIALWHKTEHALFDLSYYGA